MDNQNEILNLLKEYNINYVLNKDYNVKFHGFGIGDLLFSIISLENEIINFINRSLKSKIYEICKIDMNKSIINLFSINEQLFGY